MLIKVCGLSKEEQFLELDETQKVDFVGMIFHEKSPRNFTADLCPQLKKAKKVGVFLNKDLPFVLEKIKKHQLEIIQLHGQETVDYCLKLNGFVTVIKVFNVDEEFDFSSTDKYLEAADYFLFDTKSKMGGGSGKKFDWSILNRYTSNLPFILSGGIGEDDLDAILNFSHPQFVGIDLNSRFEIEPGIKNIEKIKNFISNVSK
jgi:phosphoribosylanthranilate isomerase